MIFNMVFVNMLLGMMRTFHCEQAPMYSLTYWELKPYIYLDNNTTNTVVGIIPSMYSAFESYCLQKNEVLIKYNPPLNDWNSFSKKFVNGVYIEKNTIWGPFISPYYLDYSNNATNVYSIKVLTQIAVVVRKESLQLHYKLMVACNRSLLVLLIVGLLCIIFGLSLSIVEQLRNPDGNLSFVSGLWWAFITLTTIGYGDVVPNTLFGRFIAVLWLFVGMVFYSILTSLVVETVTGSYVLLDKKISVFQDSFENQFANSIQASNIFPKPSYKDVFESVQYGLSDACLINPDIAAWYYDDIIDKNLIVTTLLPANIFVYLYSPTNFDEKKNNYSDCFNNYAKRFVDQSIKMYNKNPPTKNLELYKLDELLSSRAFIGSAIGVMVLISLGLAYDICNNYIQKKRNLLTKKEKSSPFELIAELESVTKI